MECYSFSNAGSLHREAGEKNQNQMFGIQGGNRLALCLSDGCDSSPYGGAAAQYVCTLTARLFFFEFYKLLAASQDAVRHRVAAVLQPALRVLAAQEGIDPEELAATILVLAVDQMGRYLCAHLGDGCILTQSQGEATEEYQVISDASRSVGSDSTGLTMDADGMQHLKVYRSFRAQERKFLLLTDGAADLVRVPGSRTLPCAFSGPELEAYLDSQCPSDDYSGSLITVP